MSLDKKILRSVVVVQVLMSFYAVHGCARTEPFKGLVELMPMTFSGARPHDSLLGLLSCKRKIADLQASTALPLIASEHATEHDAAIALDDWRKKEAALKALQDVVRSAGDTESALTHAAESREYKGAPAEKKIAKESKMKADDALTSDEHRALGDHTFFTFATLKKSIDLLPRLLETAAVRERKINYSEVTAAKGLSEVVFNAALDEYCANARESTLKRADAWLDGKAPRASFCTISEAAPRDTYVQRLQVPEDSILIAHGDLHGAIHGLLAELAEYIDIEHGFKLKNPKMYMVFLGDYVDRGMYGYECIYTLLRLKNANPDRVFLVRGNHEDEQLCTQHGFSSELASKNISLETVKKIYKWYEILPAALFVVCNKTAVQCCHGGIEAAYNPKLLLHAASPVQFERLSHLTSLNGLMWTDFAVDPTEASDKDSQQRSRYNFEDTRAYLRDASGSVQLEMIVRAHQHTGAMMKRILGLDGCNEDNHGAAKLWTAKKKTGTDVWQHSVITLNVAHDTLFGLSRQFAFDYDTHGIFTVGKDFSDWTLTIHRTKALKKAA